MAETAVSTQVMETLDETAATIPLLSYPFSDPVTDTERLVHRLNGEAFPIEVLGRVDDILVHTLFKQKRIRSRVHRICGPQKVFPELTPVHSDLGKLFPTQTKVLSTESLSLEEKGKTLGMAFIQKHAQLFPPESYRCIEHVVSRYLLFRPQTATSATLKKDGFSASVIAVKGIPMGSFIPELCSSISSNTVHQVTPQLDYASELPFVLPQAQGSISAHLLLGPLRFVQHECQPTCEVIAIPNTYAYGLRTLRDLMIGDRLTVDRRIAPYTGFSVGANCHCRTCNPPPVAAVADSKCQVVEDTQVQVADPTTPRDPFLSYPVCEPVTEEERLVDRLNKETFDAATLGKVDDMLVYSLFSARKHHIPGSKFRPLTNSPLPLTTLKEWKPIVSVQKPIQRNHNMSFEEKGKTMSAELVRQYPDHFPPETQPCVEHLAIRYLLLRDQQRKIRRVGLWTTHVEGSVRAFHAIPAGTFMYELCSSMTSDTNLESTLDKSVFPFMQAHPEQLGPSCVRLLLGPFRFVQHDCQPTCEVVAIPHTHAFGVRALRDIQAGEFVTVNRTTGAYTGFGSLRQAGELCHCRSCDSPPPEPKLPGSDSNENSRKRPNRYQFRRKNKKPKLDLESVGEPEDEPEEEPEEGEIAG